MLHIGDCVLHRSTGNLGKIIAYGHHIQDGVYLPTVKVELISDTEVKRRTFVEDVSQAWMLADQSQEKEVQLANNAALTSLV